MKRITIFMAFLCFALEAHAQVVIKNATAGTPIVFLMIDSTDHITGKTGLTPTVTISKNGGAFAAPAGAVTELANGWYRVAGNATDTNTNGMLALHAAATGADPTDMYAAVVVAYDPNDTIRLGLTALPNANAAAANGLLTSGNGANQLTTASGNVTLTPTSVQAIWDILTSNLTTANSIGQRLVNNITGDAFARLGAPAGASVSADIAAVKADTAGVKAKTDQLVFTVANKLDSNAQYIEGKQLSSLAGDNFDTFFQNGGVVTTKHVDDVSGGTGGTTDWTAAERNQIRFRLGIDGTTATPTAVPTLPVSVTTNNDKTGYSLSSGGVGAIWDESAAAHVTAGSMGKALNDTNTNAAAIKPKTDSLTFTVANKVDSNPLYVGGQLLGNKVGLNPNTFFQNNNNNTTKLVDDVGGGTGGVGDWTSTEKNQIRYRLGIDGASAVPSVIPNLNLYQYQKNVAGQKLGVTFFNVFTGNP